jgi:hypothetical protein
MNQGQPGVSAPAATPANNGRQDIPQSAGAPRPQANAGSTPANALGFFTVLEHEQLGLVGGYLLLNSAGRPLEFHCTAPIKPNRAQQILFGPTLMPYLYGEQIGQALVTKSPLTPLVVWTDVEAALAVRDYVSLPVALVIGAESAPPASPLTSTWRVDAAHTASSHLSPFCLGRNTLAVPLRRDADRQAILAQSDTLGEFDLSEPFERIREAVEEAHKSAR